MNTIAKTTIGDLDGELTTTIHNSWDEAMLADPAEDDWTIAEEKKEDGMLIRAWRNNRGNLNVVVMGESEEAIEKRATAIFTAYIGE